MFTFDNENKELIFETYGHTYTSDEIKKQYPFEDHKRFNRKRYENSPETRITYSPLIAMQLRNRGLPNIVWGQKVSNDQHAFVFRCHNEQKKIKNF